MDLDRQRRQFNPTCDDVQLGQIDLDDSEDELEIDDDGYARDVSKDSGEDEDDSAGDYLPQRIPIPLRFPVGVPAFEKVEHPAPSHGRKILCHTTLKRPYWITIFQSCQPQGAARAEPQLKPMDFFKILFTQDNFDELAINTNASARIKGAGQRGGGRYWRETSASELKVFVGLIIYIGAHKVINLTFRSVFQFNNVLNQAFRNTLYWAKNSEVPIHEISTYISQYRSEQPKRSFHVAPPSERPLPRRRWTYKIQPLADKLQ